MDIEIAYSDEPDGATGSWSFVSVNDADANSQFLAWLSVDPVTGQPALVWYDARRDDGSDENGCPDAMGQFPGPGNQCVEVFVGLGHYEQVGGQEQLKFHNQRISACQSDESCSNGDGDEFDFLEYIGVAIYDSVAHAAWADNSCDPANLNVYTDKISTRLYVDADTTAPLNDRDGANWATAYRTLQDALDHVAGLDADPEAVRSIAQIRVAAGTYRPDECDSCQTITVTPDAPGATFDIPDHLMIRGGYSGRTLLRGPMDEDRGTVDERDVQVYETTLSGEVVPGTMYAYHVVTFDNVGSGAVLEGLTITGGRATGGEPNDVGGAILLLSSDARILDCTFTDNEASASGGAIHNAGGEPRLINCRFFGNEATGAAGDGGALYNVAGGASLMNCLLSGNTAAGDGGAIYNAAAAVTLLNSTFSQNSATNSGGALFSENSGATAVNCILWGDSPGEFAGGTPTVSHSDVQGGIAGTGNIAADPQFFDADGADNMAGTPDDDLCLRVCSPCIDAGDTPSTPADIQDIDRDANVWEKTPDLVKSFRVFDHPEVADTGNDDPPVFAGVVVDMGAFEFNLAGNLNSDTAINGLDIQGFTDCLVGGSVTGGCKGADMDRNDVLDLLDVACFVELLVSGTTSCTVSCGESAQSGGGSGGESAQEQGGGAASAGDAGSVSDGGGDSAPQPVVQDCDGDGVADADEIASGTSADCNADAYPDACNLALVVFTSYDCNDNGVPDECDVAGCPPGDASCADANANGFLDACEQALGLPVAAPGAAGSTEALVQFCEWSIEQTWGPASGRSGAEQFQVVINKLEELGLPIENPWLIGQ